MFEKNEKPCVFNVSAQIRMLYIVDTDKYNDEILWGFVDMGKR